MHPILILMIILGANQWEELALNRPYDIDDITPPSHSGAAEGGIYLRSLSAQTLWY